VDNVYEKVKGIVSKVANDNSVPASVWLSKFLKVGFIIAILVGIVLIFSK
jgi:hypothetical protein